MTLEEQKIIRRIVRAEYRRIREKNPAFSQRAFAKKIKVNSGTLSAILQGKRKISAQSSRAILSRLPIDESYRAWLSETLASKKKGEGLAIKRTLLDLDRFEIVASPVHLNALNLLRTSGAEPNLPWLAKRLKKSRAEVSEVVERLKRAGLLQEEKDRLLPTSEPLRTPESFPHHAVRAFHRATLEEAKDKLESVPVALRDFSSITIPGDPAKLEEVRALIRSFRDSVSFLLGAEPGSEVFKLSVQFYPVASEGEE